MATRTTSEISRGSLVAWFALAISLIAGIISNQVTQTKMSAAIEANTRAIQEFREVRSVQVDVLQVLSANAEAHRSMNARITALESQCRPRE